MQRMTSEWHFNSEKYSVHYERAPEAQRLVRFALGAAVFETQGCRKNSKCIE